MDTILSTTIKNMPVRSYFNNKTVFMAKHIPHIGYVKRINKNGIIVSGVGLIEYDDLDVKATTSLVEYFQNCQKYLAEVQAITAELQATHIKGFNVLLHGDSIKKIEFLVVFEARVAISYLTINNVMKAKFRSLKYKASSSRDLSEVYVSYIHQEFKNMPFYKRWWYNITHLF